jgi:hypothetical protein
MHIAVQQKGELKKGTIASIDRFDKYFLLYRDIEQDPFAVYHN